MDQGEGKSNRQCVVMGGRMWVAAGISIISRISRIRSAESAGISIIIRINDPSCIHTMIRLPPYKATWRTGWTRWVRLGGAG